jgi:acylphosphatase
MAERASASPGGRCRPVVYRQVVSATAIHAFVSGHVQGVYFRQSCRQAARKLHLHGWVRNIPDGRVEVWAQGPPTAVEALVDWLWMGPPTANVTGVESDVVGFDPNVQDFLIIH